MAVSQASPVTIVHGEASLLLRELLADPWGQVSVSVYDTARLVSAVPWLPGHTARLDYLCDTQASDGSWGGPAGYALVPTLSATESLLAELSRRTVHQSDRVRATARRGLGALYRMCNSDTTGVRTPDTIAVELVAPTLVAQVNHHVEAGIPDRPSGALRTPPDLSRAAVAPFLAEIASGRSLPAKLWAALEVFGDAAVAAPFIRPEGGAVAGSPAATAAWLGRSMHDTRSQAERESAWFLDALQARGAGPVPAVTPITYFEPAWVLNSLATAGVAYEVPSALLDRLEGALGEHGAPAGPGIAVDADDTAGVLCALARHGRLHSPDALLRYRTDGYFTCFPDERTPSTSTNAHVLEALSLYLELRPAERPRFGAAATMAAAWLLDNQQQDGSRQDKWHASPFYATVCCAAALAVHGDDSCRNALARALEWILCTQRNDGSWGLWQGTVEETAYAVQTIASLGPTLPARASAIVAAADRGHGFLRAANDPATYPGLWHAKDLYAPTAVIRAARLAALHIGDALSHPASATAG